MPRADDDHITPRVPRWNEHIEVPAPSFQIFDHIPLGCELMPIANDQAEPHFRPGELAVIDTTKQPFESGAIYRVTYRTQRVGRIDVRELIYRATMREYDGINGPANGIYFNPLQGAALLPDGSIDWSQPKRVRLSNGPLNPIYLDQYITGRVVGLFQALPPLVKPLALPWDAPVSGGRP